MEQGASVEPDVMSPIKAMSIIVIILIVMFNFYPRALLNAYPKTLSDLFSKAKIVPSFLKGMRAASLFQERRILMTERNNNRLRVFL